MAIRLFLFLTKYIPYGNVVVQEDAPEVDGELTQLTGGTDGSSPKALPTIWSEVSAFSSTYNRAFKL